MKAVTMRLVIASLSLTSVFSITIQRKAVFTPLPERSSTTVVKMLHQIKEDSKKASKSGAETYSKVICLCDETRQEAEAVTEQTTADTFRSSVVRATDCRSAGPWFNSWRRSWFTFVTWSNNLINQIIQMMNIKSPMTRKSVKMVAELCNGTALWIPDTATSRLEDHSAVAKTLHANRAFMVVAADPLSLIALKPPSEFGIDAVVGWMQWFGAHIDTGSPATVYLATSLKQVCRMPRRLIGESLDRLGNSIFRLTLQTREQHIRLDKTISNVCTAQTLLANMVAMYVVCHRTDGLKTIAKRVHGVSQFFASELAKLGIDASPFFDTVVFDVSPSLLPILSRRSKPSISTIAHLIPSSCLHPSTRRTTLKTCTLSLLL